MKKARIINLAVCAVLTAGLITAVCLTWHLLGCGKESLWVAIGGYGLLCSLGCATIDASIKDYFKNK